MAHVSGGAERDAGVALAGDVRGVRLDDRDAGVSYEVRPIDQLRNALNRRATAARKVIKADPTVDRLLLLSYVVWPGEREQILRERQAA